MARGYTSAPRSLTRHGASEIMAAQRRRVPRLYLERDLSGDKLTLDEREAHYLSHVLRLKRGDELVAFNGRGSERRASIGTLQRRGAELELRASVDALPASPLELTLIQALPKSDAMDLIVEKATELGASAIVPVYTEFSVVKLDTERAERRVEHWRKKAQSACEQCGRHAPPTIAVPAELASCLDALSEGGARLALDPDSTARLPRPAAGPRRIAVAVGPEGGFGTSDWRRLDGALFERIGLGPRVLRAETAALAVCAVAQSLWGDV
jgi:16S rRNA (uracil1498-N3)-methyltransferase